MNDLTLWKRIVDNYKRGTLFAKAWWRLKRLKYLIYNPASNITLHCPPYVDPSLSSTQEAKIVERIFRAYKKMKEDQVKHPNFYLPSSLWQKQIQDAYSYLISGLKDNYIHKFHYFLANFGAWEVYNGVESTTLIRDNMGSLINRRYLQNDVFYKQLKIWKWFYGDRKPISVLSYPQFGNQLGAYIEGIFVGVGSFFNEIYGSLLSGLIRDTERPAIAELGAGYGKMAYFALRDIERFTYVDFDLPEPLCLAAYYLMMAYPDKEALLYGEEDYSKDSHENYDLIFMPSYEISKLCTNEIDLFINTYSLGEMTQEAANNFVAHIARSTRYFFHMNHDIYPNIYSGHDRGLLGCEYPMPKDKFKLLYRYPDIGHLLNQGFLNFGSDTFIYLYERKSAVPSSNRVVAELSGGR